MPVTSNRRAVVARFDQALSRGIAKLALDVTANLKETTPVDTGWARANWVPSVGTPAQGTAGSRDRVTQGPQAQGEARMLGYKISQGAAFITNNVPYIGELNAGSSAKAPAGFVEAAIMRAIRGLAGVDIETLI